MAAAMPSAAGGDVSAMLEAHAKRVDDRLQRIEAALLDLAVARGGPAAAAPVEAPTSGAPPQPPAAPLPTPVVVEDVMISYRCKTAQAHADALKGLLEAAGVSVFVCSETLRAGEGYRSRIAQTAALCKVMVPLVDQAWAESGECAYEYNIAVRTNLVTKTRPVIIPVAMPDIQPFMGDPIQLAQRFPLLMGVAANINAVFLAGGPLQAAFQPVADAVKPHVTAASSSASPASFTSVPLVEGKHVPASWGVGAEWEGYFVVPWAWEGVDGKRIGSGQQAPIELSALLLEDGTFAATGRDPVCSADYAGRVDPTSGEVVLRKTNKYMPTATNACGCCNGLASPDERRLHTLHVFYKGEVKGRALVGRWSFTDVPFDEMDPRCYWSVWPRAGTGAALGDWFDRVHNNPPLLHHA